jgi:tRNA-Thr(GGU) m(6)t(6)A37 methyltransferase TsaA
MQTFPVVPIGTVRSPRVEATDDYWGDVVSTIEFDAAELEPSATDGLAEFSHIEVIYRFHLVAEQRRQTGARHPRNNAEWPMVGILAQRAKARPNLIGLTTCQLLAVDGLVVTVRGLDAIDGTPVLDVKPYLAEFAPRGEVRQPAWSHELMDRYW